MKKYIIPEIEIGNIELCEMIATSIDMAGTTSDEGVESMDSKDIYDLDFDFKNGIW